MTALHDIAPAPRRIPWRGGPDIGTYAEAEYAAEQADFDLYGEDELCP